MEEKTTLCVSVQAGDHLLSGPDWIKIEDSKTLIDALVEVSGTQALGYQVQVVVSKEPSFTEAALIQVVNQVSMLRDSGSVYVKFLLKSSVLSSQKRYEESKCKAERDTDIMSPLDTLQMQEQQKQEEDNIYNFINSTFDKPFESNYLNKLFSEHKLSPSTLSSLKDELARKHSHKEVEQYTTWSQQSELAAQSGNQDAITGQCSDTKEQLLTDWSDSKTTSAGESNAVVQDGDNEDARKAGGKLEETGGCLAGDLKSSSDQKHGAKSKQLVEATELASNAKGKVPEAPKGKTPLPKTNRSMTLRAKKNAGMLKKDKKDLAKSGMPILCQKVTRVSPSKVGQIRQRSSVTKIKDRESSSSIRKGTLAMDGEKKVVKSKKGVAPTQASKEKSDSVGNRTGSLCSGRKSSLKSSKETGNDSKSVTSKTCAADNERHEDIKRRNVETLEDQERNSHADRKSSDSNLLQLKQRDLSDKGNSILKSPGKGKAELFVSTESGYDGSKDSCEKLFVDSMLEEKYNDDAALDTSSVLEWEIIDSGGRRSSPCHSLQEDATLTVNSKDTSQGPRSPGRIPMERFPVLGQKAPQSEAINCSFDIAQDILLSPTDITSAQSERFSIDKQLLCDSFESGKQKRGSSEIIKTEGNPNGVSSVSHNRAGTEKESSTFCETTIGQHLLEVRQSSSLSCELKKDLSKCKLKNSFDSFDIMDSSEARRKSSVAIDNCVRRTESLGRNSSSPTKKKSGFFHQLKEKTIDFDGFLIPSVKSDSYCKFSEDLGKGEKIQSSELSELNLDVGCTDRIPGVSILYEKSPSSSERSKLNLTIDKITLETDSCLSVDGRKEGSEKNSPVYLSDVGRYSPANRTFSLDEDNGDGLTALPGTESGVQSMDGHTGNFVGNETDALDVNNIKCQSRVSEKDDEDKGSFLNNLDKDIECHVRRHWDESQGIMDQLLLTSLADLTGELNASANRIINAVRSDHSIRKTPFVVNVSQRPLPEDLSRAKGDSALIFHRLKRLEKQLLDMEGMFEKPTSN